MSRLIKKKTFYWNQRRWKILLRSLIYISWQINLLRVSTKQTCSEITQTRLLSASLYPRAAPQIYNQYNSGLNSNNTNTHLTLPSQNGRDWPKNSIHSFILPKAQPPEQKHFRESLWIQLTRPLLLRLKSRKKVFIKPFAFKEQ